MPRVNPAQVRRSSSFTAAPAASSSRRVSGRPPSSSSESLRTSAAACALAGACFGCGDGADTTQTRASAGALEKTLGANGQPLSAVAHGCFSDPRVTSGLVPLDVCAGARVFFDETFDGNGRTCATCHRVENSFTVDPAFIATLDASDPLFVAETRPALADLETPHLRDFGVIKENVDGFESPNKFTIRSIPHLLSMATSIERDPTDGTSAEFVERTGWSGDGVAGGALRDFLDGAIVQHYPTDLGRVEGTAFRLATAEELDEVLAFQLELGRKNELDLESVSLSDPFAEQGRIAFLDPNASRCNTCHANAGGNALATGKNANFNTGFDTITPSAFELPTFAGVELRDGGFGGLGLAEPNFPPQAPNAFGDGTFNVPPLIEAADTAPFFHNSGLSSLVAAVALYGSNVFNDSPAASQVGPIELPGAAAAQIGQFLRVLNAAFNLSLSVQRLEASELLNFQYWNYREDVQRGLIELANEELSDAVRVLDTLEGPPMHAAEIAALRAAAVVLESAESAADPAVRLQLTRDALDEVNEARAGLGENLDFELGAGNLMF